MKYLILLLILFNSLLISQWEVQQSGTNINLRDICFIDSLYGWAVGDSGVIIKTSDGGESWASIYTPSDTIEFKLVQFLDRENGFVAGNILKQHSYYLSHQVLLLHTANGGYSWERIDTSFDSSFNFGNLKFLNPDTGWISINNSGQTSWDERKGILLKTTNGGSLWTTLKEENFLLCEAFDFDNGQAFSFWSPFVSNSDPTYVYSSSDNGYTWDWVGTINEELVKKSIYKLDDFLWAIGFKTSLSINYGKDWQTWNWFVSIGGQKRFIPTDIEVITSDDVFLLGDAMTSANDIEGRLYKTNDTGETWWIDLQMLNSSFFGLCLINGKKGWIVGSNGLILYNDDTITDVKPIKKEFPINFHLGQNFPNPFNPSTRIEFSVSQQSWITLNVYDVLGKKIETLLDEDKSPGNYQIDFNANNVVSGIYFYRITADEFSETKKMILIR